MKFVDWLYLKWHGYCTKHLVPLDVGCMGYEPFSFCPQCEQEESEKQMLKIESILARYQGANHDQR